MVEINSENVCNECQRKFSDKYVLRRHRNNYCRVLREREENTGDSIINEENTIGGELFNLKNRVADISDRLSSESVTAWKRRKLFKRETVDLINDVNKDSPDQPTYMSDILELINTQVKNVLETTMEATFDAKWNAKYDLALCTKENGSKEAEKDSKIDIVCLAKGDYIKKLIQLHDGDEEKAMNYIKNVGIAMDFLEGDFRMIKKIYFDGKKKSQFPIRIKDYKRNKLEYLEENGEWVLDIRGEIVGKRLCENIVSTLLIANTQFNEVIINERDEDRKEILLDLFQINKTQAHIMKLLERKTQGKLSRRVAEFINYCTEVQAETGSLETVKKVYE